MRLIACAFPVSKADQVWLVNGRHTGARLALHFKNVQDRFERTNSCLLGMTTANASSNYSMSLELKSTLEASAIQWPALRNHIPCMAHIIQLALGAFMSCLGVKGHTKSWEAHERDQPFGENESIDIGKRQRLWKEGNARINKVSAMKPRFITIIEKVCISWHFGTPEIDLHIAENGCCIDSADAWLSKRVHWHWKSQSLHRCTTDYGCEDMVELRTGVAEARLPITGIHTRVAAKYKIHWSLATFHNSRWVDHSEVCSGSIEAISILDPVVVKVAYSHIASRYHSVQHHVRSHGRRNESFGDEEDSMEGRFVHCYEVSSTGAVQILRWSDSNNKHAAVLCTYRRSFSEVAIV